MSTTMTFRDSDGNKIKTMRNRHSSTVPVEGEEINLEGTEYVVEKTNSTTFFIESEGPMKNNMEKDVDVYVKET